MAVVEQLLSGKLDRAIQSETPSFYKEADRDELARIFDGVINAIKDFSSEENKLSPVQPVLLMIKKARSLKDLKSMASMKDTLIEFAMKFKTSFRKSEIFKAITEEPFSVDLWHTFEKAAQNYTDTSTHQATASSHTYETLFDNGEWKLFVPHSFEDDSHLAGGLEEFKCINSQRKISSSNKAQWCTAADPYFYKKYSHDGNRFYLVKHYLPNGDCDKAFQVAFDEDTHIEIKDKFDLDLGEHFSDKVNRNELDYFFDNAPKEVLAKIVNDNPTSKIKKSLLDYVNLSKTVSPDKYLNINSVIFRDDKEIIDYYKKGYLTYIDAYNDPDNQEVAPNPDGEPMSVSAVPKFAKKVIVPDGMELCMEAFFNCKELEQVQLPHTLKEIPYGAFENCESLKNIIIPEGVEKIEACSFKDCINLTHVSLPKSLKKIDMDAFCGCDILKHVTIPENVKDIVSTDWNPADCLESVTVLSKDAKFDNISDIFDNQPIIYVTPDYMFIDELKNEYDQSLIKILKGDEDENVFFDEVYHESLER